MAQRVFNFSAGPAVLPLEVLQQAQEDLLALPGVGSSILEISHRSGTFTEIVNAAEANLRQLLGIPDNYRIVFLQGGSRLQFSMIPMNLLDGKSADYITTGNWGEIAFEEARREGPVRLAWDGKSSNYNSVPQNDELDLGCRGCLRIFHFQRNDPGGSVSQRASDGERSAGVRCLE